MKIFTADNFYKTRLFQAKEATSNDSGGKSIGIFIANLHIHAGKGCIYELFQEFGRVLSVCIPMDGYKRQSGGRGYIKMSERSAGLLAIRKLHQLNFMNQFLEVREIRPYEASIIND